MAGKLTLFLTLLCALSAFAAKPLWHELEGYSFAQYEKDFAKVYNTPSNRAMRQMLFETELKRVTQFNTLGKSWKEGVNHMSDWTVGEVGNLGENSAIFLALSMDRG